MDEYIPIWSTDRKEPAHPHSILTPKDGSPDQPLNNKGQGGIPRSTHPTIRGKDGSPDQRTFKSIRGKDGSPDQRTFHTERGKEVSPDQPLNNKGQGWVPRSTEQ